MDLFTKMHSIDFGADHIEDGWERMAENLQVSHWHFIRSGVSGAL